MASSSALDTAFCKSALPAAKKNLGIDNTKIKAFPFNGGVWCSYGGSHGAYVQKVPHVTAAAFKAKEPAGAKSVSGLGAPAYSATTSSSYLELSILKGTTELVIGARVGPAPEKTAAKEILPLVH